MSGLSAAKSISALNIVSDQTAPSPSSPTKPNGIHIVVNTPGNTGVRAPPGSNLVHVVRRKEEGEDDTATEGDEVGPLPSPRPKRPTLKVSTFNKFYITYLQL